MQELSTLVTRYIDGTIDYREFRRAFVMEFSSVRGTDAALDQMIDSIASEFDDLSNGLLSEQQLKLNLADRLSPFQSRIIFQRFDLSDFQQGVVRTGTSTVLSPAGWAGQLVGVGRALEYA
jgi:hypothetical protein